MELPLNNRILIVDDSPAIHNDFRKILEAESTDFEDAAQEFLGIKRTSIPRVSYQLTSAFQGQEALELVMNSLERDEPFAVAFVDMRMPPGWDGMQTIRELWQVDHNLQVVICTAYSDHSWRELQEEFGRVDNLLILKKPFDSTEVSQLTVALTEKWKLQRDRDVALQQVLIANKAKSEFVAKMSHELRTPLHGILGMTQLLANTELTAQQSRYLEACRASSESLLSVIGNILDFSKIEAGYNDVHSEPTNLLELLEGVAQSVGAGLAAKNPELDLTCFVDPAIPGQVMSDVGKLRQVLFNLAGNASKFTEKGNIALAARAITIEEEITTVEFSVRDTGPGIPADQLPHIFDPFSQIGEAEQRNKGAGLGLNICHELVRLMGGEIVVESEIDVGTHFRFRLRLPICKEQPEVVDGSAVLGNLRIGTVGLSVEAHESIREIVGGWKLECEQVFMQREEDPIQDLNKFQVLIVDYANQPSKLMRFLHKLEGCPHQADLQIVPLCNPGSEPQGDVILDSTFRLSSPLLKPVCQTSLFAQLQVCIREEGGDASEEPRRAALRASELHRKLRILLVEDNEVNTLFAESLFDAAGVEYVTCCDGQQAVDQVEQQDDFDLIFMDCQMPVMDGLEAATIITTWAKEGKVREIPIVALTANATEEASDQCFKAGMVDAIAKPFVVEDLYKAIDRFCFQT